MFIEACVSSPDRRTSGYDVTIVCEDHSPFFYPALFPAHFSDSPLKHRPTPYFQEPPKVPPTHHNLSGGKKLVRSSFHASFPGTPHVTLPPMQSIMSFRTKFAMSSSCPFIRRCKVIFCSFFDPCLPLIYLLLIDVCCRIAPSSPFSGLFPPLAKSVDFTLSCSPPPLYIWD